MAKPKKDKSTEINAALSSAIREQVVERNQDIGDTSLIDTVSNIITASRLKNVSKADEEGLSGDVVAPTEAIVKEASEKGTVKASRKGDWQYKETLEGTWELKKKQSEGNK